MKLPEPIFSLVQEHFACHGCWHELRLLDSPELQKMRDKCFPKGPGSLWPKGLRSIQQQGCGEDFLRFHREMVRNFKWIVEKQALGSYTYVPWRDFPTWLSSALDQAGGPGYRGKLASDLARMVKHASLDELGQYIEGENDAELHIHFGVHAIVHEYEERQFGDQPQSDMGYFATAPRNEHFWGFHGWIDEIYAQWQRSHNERVDQSALKSHMHPTCAACQHQDREGSWLPLWEGYLKNRSEEVR
jgi:hypothetical protein